MQDTTDHTITKPCEPEARISREEFKRLLDGVYALSRGAGSVSAGDIKDQLPLLQVEPFKTWATTWYHAPEVPASVCLLD